MNPTTILTLIHQALQEDTFTHSLLQPSTNTTPATERTHTITYNPSTQEITITEGITYLDPQPEQRPTINIANPNLFHLIHQHLHQTNKPTIPLPAGDRDKGQEADSYKHHPPRGNA